MWLMLRWLWTLVMVRIICDGLNVSVWLVLDARCWWRSGSNCDGLFVNAWLVHDASYWQRRGSDWEGLDVVGNVMTGVISVVMIKGADDVMAGMAV